MDWSQFRVILFDLDGVLTPTTQIHRKAWAKMFNDYLREIGDDRTYTDDDYYKFVDGKPRYAGVRNYLESLGLNLSEEEVVRLGDLKNDDFSAVLERDGIEAYPGSKRLIDQLHDAGVKMCVVSSSRNALAVLDAAGIRDYFEHVVDGNVAREQGLAGKPAPDTYSYAAHLCGEQNSAAVVVEDAISGVQAGAAGNFGLVIGVDRGAGVEALEASGAQLVVSDLEELTK